MLVLPAMPTDPATPDPPNPEGAPPKGDPPPPAGPTTDDVRTIIREELTTLLAGGGKPEGDPDLSTDKKLEAFVEKLVRDAMTVILEDEKRSGTDPPEPPDTSKVDPPAPEGEPEQKTTWQARLQKFVWGEIQK